MTDASLTEKIRILHAETVAAIEQRQTLAVAARHALIAALRNRLICRPGCEDALATWGLEPLPHRWTVSADAQLTHMRSHADQAEAREQARFGAPEELRLLRPAMAVYPTHVLDLTPVANGGEQCGSQEYRITVQATLRTWVTAARQADAYAAARAIVEGHRSALADAGITLTRLTWQAADAADTVPQDAVDAGAQPEAGVAPLVELADDLTAATAARDAAVQALTDLRRRIRSRAIRALVDDEIGGVYQHTARRVDRFLVDLGLDGLPRAHHVTVVADLMLPVTGETAGDACDAARDVMGAATTSSPDETRPWTAYGGTIPEYATRGQGGWRIPWRHEYDMWLRGHATSDDATAAARVLAGADLTRALAGLGDVLITVAATAADAEIDLYLDPDRD
ncbi:hypothetical protein OG994_12025 [Micromonospora globbae]|uniref:DUF222 domain-containing protein n=1 Tax=Micromonospora globbae TaxID=1894969 RepID=A0ABZ1SD52_9ACTN|nr:hypothetical protein [Micromonospora globbae]